MCSIDMELNPLIFGASRSLMIFGIRDTVKATVYTSCLYFIRLLRLTGTILSRQGLNLREITAFKGLTTMERSHATIHRRSKKITVGQRKGISTDSRTVFYHMA